MLIRGAARQWLDAFAPALRAHQIKYPEHPPTEIVDVLDWEAVAAWHYQHMEWDEIIYSLDYSNTCPDELPVMRCQRARYPHAPIEALL